LAERRGRAAADLVEGISLMMTLRTFQKGLTSVPLATAWSLAELGQAIGRQSCSPGSRRSGSGFYVSML
jgi:hypothetical protein